MLIRVQIKKIFLHTRPPRKKRKKSKLLSFLAGHYCEFFPSSLRKRKEKRKKKGWEKATIFLLPKIKFDAQLPNFGNPKKERHSSTPQKKCPTAIFFFAKKHNKKLKKGDNHSHYLIIFLLTHPDAPDSLRAIHPVASKKNPKKEFPLLCPSSTVFREGLFPLHKKIFKLFHVNPVQGFC